LGDEVKGYLLHASFLASAYELPKDISKKVWKALHFFSRNPRHPSLQWEQLRGRAAAFQSLRVDNNYRIIIEPDQNTPGLVYVGPHDKAYDFAERMFTPPLAEVAEDMVSYGSISEPSHESIELSPETVKDLVLRTVKYLPIATFLMGRHSASAEVQLTFAEIENLIRANLPKAARTYRAWWANEKGKSRHVQANAWMAVGWKVQGVDFDRQVVTFSRAETRAT